MPFYVCSLPNTKGAGSISELITDDDTAIMAFLAREDCPGRAVYKCENLLIPGAKARTIETIGAVRVIHVDLDFKDVEEPPEEILRRLQALPEPPSEIRFTGGGYHCIWILREPIERGDRDFDRVPHILKALVLRCVATRRRRTLPRSFAW